jgi:hypothetical protein
MSHRPEPARRRAPVAGAPEAGGAHRHRRPQGTLPAQPPAHYEPYVSGLFTYCLSALHEHDAATAALGNVLALAERQRSRLRDAESRRAWLYALARWACLRRLAEGRPAPGPARAEVAERRRRELASLEWPEAAGTTPTQREALELAVRHRLRTREIAAVLGVDEAAARTVLSQAACEVERTRAALTAAAQSRCAGVSDLVTEPRPALTAGLRNELVGHVDACPRCRSAAERSTAGAGGWPGLSATAAASAVLPLVEAPRSAAYAALLDAMRDGAGRSRQGTPRFDRRGFPAFPGSAADPAVRRERLRSRAVTSTVVAAVVAAPVLAVWAATHGGTLGDGRPEGPLAADGPSRAAHGGGATESADGHRTPFGTPVRGGRGIAPAPPAAPTTAATGTSTATSAARPGDPGDPGPGAGSGTAADPALGAPLTASVAPPAPAASAAPAPHLPERPGRPSRMGPLARPGHPGGRLTVSARARGDVTLVTLTAQGGPVRWRAGTSAPWLRLSASGGVVPAGRSATFVVRVDRAAQPVGDWTARVVVDPGGAVVTLHGAGPAPAPPPAAPSQQPPDQGPSAVPPQPQPEPAAS